MKRCPCYKCIRLHHGFAVFELLHMGTKARLLDPSCEHELPSYLDAMMTCGPCLAKCYSVIWGLSSQCLVALQNEVSSVTVRPCFVAVSEGILSSSVVLCMVQSYTAEALLLMVITPLLLQCMSRLCSMALALRFQSLSVSQVLQVPLIMRACTAAGASVKHTAPSK